MMDSDLGKPLEEIRRELARAERLLNESADFVRAQTSVPANPDIPRAADDPHIILRFGQLRARLHAAEGLLARAVRLAGSSDATEANLSAIEARAFVGDLVAEINGQLTAWGASAPNHWNYYHVGNYYLKDNASDLVRR